MNAEFKAELDARDKALGEATNGLLAERDKATGELKTKIDAALAAIDEQKKSLAELLARAERQSIPGLEVAKTADDKEKYSLGRLMQLVTKYNGAKPTDKRFGLEVEVSKKMFDRLDTFEPEHVKAINAASGSAGAYLISTEVQDSLIPDLRDATVSIGLGIRVWTGLSGNQSWPRTVTGATAAYFDTENDGTITKSTPTFGNMEMSPHVYGAMVDLTWKMLNQPSMALEPWVREQIAYRIGRLKDQSFFLGSGAASTPRGLKNSGIQTFDLSQGGNTKYSGGSQSLTDALMKVIAKLPENNANFPGQKLGWATSPFVVTALTLAKDGDGRPLFWPHATGNIETNKGRLGQLLGVQIGETKLLDFGASVTDTEEMYYGDFNQAVDANWGTLAFATSDQHDQNFNKGLVSVRAIGAHDVGVIQPLAFVRGTTFEASTLPTS